MSHPEATRSGATRPKAVLIGPPGSGKSTVGAALAERLEPGEVDVVLWPENSSDINPRVDAEAAAAVTAVAQALGAPILVGTDRYPDEGGRYNESVLWDPVAGAGAARLNSGKTFRR